MRNMVVVYGRNLTEVSQQEMRCMEKRYYKEIRTMEITEVKEQADKICENISRVLIGREKEIRVILAALLREVMYWWRTDREPVRHF